jgi:hypothetical protein
VDLQTVTPTCGPRITAGVVHNRVEPALPEIFATSTMRREGHWIGIRMITDSSKLRVSVTTKQRRDKLMQLPGLGST